MQDEAKDDTATGDPEKVDLPTTFPQFDVVSLTISAVLFEFVSQDANDDTEEHQVVDPLSIIFRMQSEKAEQSDAIATADWNKRVSLYFAYCVDGGLYPTKLTVRKLSMVCSISARVPPYFGCVF